MLFFPHRPQWTGGKVFTSWKWSARRIFPPPFAEHSCTSALSVLVNIHYFQRHNVPNAHFTPGPSAAVETDWNLRNRITIGSDHPIIETTLAIFVRITWRQLNSWCNNDVKRDKLYRVAHKKKTKKKTGSNCKKYSWTILFGNNVLFMWTTIGTVNNQYLYLTLYLQLL